MGPALDDPEAAQKREKQMFEWLDIFLKTQKICSYSMTASCQLWPAALPRFYFVLFFFPFFFRVPIFGFSE